jgi:hypothetical protein
MKNSLFISGYSVFFFALSITVAFCQTSKTPLDKGFIEKTIAYYYGRQVKSHPGNRLFFIERDSFDTNTKTDYGTFNVQFVSTDEMAAKLAGAVRKTGQLDRIVIKWVSLDTIDVAITRCTLEARKVNKMANGQPKTTIEHSISGCVEANVEIPTCRFVYNRPTSAWAQLDDGRLVKKN